MCTNEMIDNKSKNLKTFKHVQKRKMSTDSFKNIINKMFYESYIFNMLVKLYWI